MVLAELAGRIAQRLEQFGDRRIFLLQARRGARQADLRIARAEHALSGNERRAVGGAALLAVIVGEYHPLAGDAIDVWRTETQQAQRVGADIGYADVVAPDNKGCWACGRELRPAVVPVPF